MERIHAGRKRRGAQIGSPRAQASSAQDAKPNIFRATKRARKTQRTQGTLKLLIRLFQAVISYIKITHILYICVQKYKNKASPQSVKIEK